MIGSTLCLFARFAGRPEGADPVRSSQTRVDLIQPRRIRRREVQPHVRVRDQERPHRLRPVGRPRVDDDMDLAALGLAGTAVVPRADPK